MSSPASCERCGSAIGVGARFCSQCGAPHGPGAGSAGAADLAHVTTVVSTTTTTRTLQPLEKPGETPAPMSLARRCALGAILATLGGGAVYLISQAQDPETDPPPAARLDDLPRERGYYLVRGIDLAGLGTQLLKHDVRLAVRVPDRSGGDPALPPATPDGVCDFAIDAGPATVRITAESRPDDLLTQLRRGGLAPGTQLWFWGQLQSLEPEARWTIVLDRWEARAGAREGS